HTVFFCKTDLFPHRSGQAPSPDTAGTAADNKKIIVEAGHGSLQSILHWPICRQNKKPGQVTGLLNSALPSEITAVRAAPEQQQRQPVPPELQQRWLRDRARCRSAKYLRPSRLHASQSDLPTEASCPQATYKTLR